MAQRDPAKAIKTALVDFFDDTDVSVTLEVPDDYTPVDGEPVLLVADDGGNQVSTGAWMAGKGLLSITIRMTAFARGRTEARATLDAAMDHLLANRPEDVARIENVPAVLDTRDRETGAYLASIAMPVIVRPPTA
ncbi:MAG: hypothetical protein WD072_03425 [Pirellulales bacterium]